MFYPSSVPFMIILEKNCCWWFNLLHSLVSDGWNWIESELRVSHQQDCWFHVLFRSSLMEIMKNRRPWMKMILAMIGIFYHLIDHTKRPSPFEAYSFISHHNFIIKGIEWFYHFYNLFCMSYLNQKHTGYLANIWCRGTRLVFLPHYMIAR